MKGDAEYFGRLAGDGFNVYVYDEVGSGRSSRLEDPRGYTLERDVADLEAIREEIGAKRLVLIGHSYGGTLAAAYAACTRRAWRRWSSPSRETPRPPRAGRACSFASRRERRSASTPSSCPRARCSPTLCCR